MATVTGFTAERMLVIENETVVDGEVVGDNLHLLRRDGVPIDAGNVRGATGATGPKGDPGTNGTNGTNGKDGLGVPLGGLAGQLLAKNSDTDNDTLWRPETRLLVVTGRMTFWSGGSRNAGSYTSGTIRTQACPVPSQLFGWVRGSQGYSATTTGTNVNFSIIRSDTGAHLCDSGGLQVPHNALTLAIPAFCINIYPIAANETVPLYSTCSIGGGNNYFTLEFNYMLFPI